MLYGLRSYLRLKHRTTLATRSIQYFPYSPPPKLTLRWRRGIVQFFWISWAERTTKRSEVVRAPGNEVFALLDRTGTGQCPVGAAFDWLLPPCRFWRRGRHFLRLESFAF